MTARAQNIVNNIRKHLTPIVVNIQDYMHPVEVFDNIYQTEKVAIASNGIWVSKVKVGEYTVDFTFVESGNPARQELSTAARANFLRLLESREYSKVRPTLNGLRVTFGDTGDDEADRALPIIFACFLMEFGLPVDTLDLPGEVQ